MSNPIEIDETTLTAYALGELPPDHMSAVEAFLATNPDAREQVATIRATAADLQAALATEPATSLTLPQRATILKAANRTPDGAQGRTARRALAIAACVALAATGAVWVMAPSLNRAREVAQVDSIRSTADPIDDRSSTQSEAGRKQGVPDAATTGKPVAPVVMGPPPVSKPKINTTVQMPDDGTVGGQTLNGRTVTLKEAKISAGIEEERQIAQRQHVEYAAVSIAEPGAVPNTGMALSGPRGVLGGKAGADTTKSEPASEVIPFQIAPKTQVAADSIQQGQRSNAGYIPSPKPASAQPQSPMIRSGISRDKVVVGQSVRRSEVEKSFIDLSETGSYRRPEAAREQLARADAAEIAQPVDRWAMVDKDIQQLGVAEDQRAANFNTESYARINDNPFLAAMQNPLSTFSIDVDTASYSNVRRFLMGGQLPPADAVRIEELVNYFPYDYPQPTGETPFAANVEVAGCPWAPEHRLVRVGLRGRDVAVDGVNKAAPKNLVFLIDVSGSMQAANKLPLLKESMKLLVRELADQDKVTIAVYAGQSGLVLPTTTVGSQDVLWFSDEQVIQKLWDEKYAPKLVTINGKVANFAQVSAEYEAAAKKLHESLRMTGRNKILASIDRLEAGGSTNGAAGIQLAYEQAVSAFIKDGVNRVILCTDGDFNVGITNEGDLTRLIEEKAKSGVFLSVLGYGMGNVKDATMEKLADKGNGNYGYIDTLAEARKALVEQMNGTLVTIAKDVKIQVEFNPAKVGSYRLIGYENRMLAKEDFNDDKKDAGEIGAGHTVTALYEVVPVGIEPVATQPGVDPLKYGPKPTAENEEQRRASDELVTLKLRYKAPDAPLEQGTSKLLEFPVKDAGAAFATASKDFKFAAAVAAYGMVLRDSPHKGTATLSAAAEMAVEGKGEDKQGYRAELVELVRKAKELKGSR